MNNVKRIIAAGLVGTAVISTGVVASAEEITYREAAQDALLSANMPADAAADLVSMCEKLTLTEEQAEFLQGKINETLSAVEGYTSKDIYDNKNDIQTTLQDDVKSPIEKKLGLTISATTTTGLKVKVDDTKEVVLNWTVDQIKAINKAADKKALQNNAVAPLMDFAKQTDKNAVKPGPDPKPDKPATETPDTPFTPGDSTTTQEYVDAVNKLEAGKDWTDEQVKALEDIKKLVTDMLENGFTLDQLNQAEALLAKLPADSEQYKTLKATIDYLKTYQNNNGQTAGDAQVEATKTPSNNNNNGSATSGSTAKTATNFGNVAVAGLGLMTVAGTVFVISKKKIQ